MNEILAEAHRFFGLRRPGSWVPAYLVERGFTEETQRRWQVGYAPGTWTALTEHLRGLGHADAEIEGAGLARTSGRGRLYDRFRDRAVLPIRDGEGQVAGFIARARPGTGGPKYVNSPASSYFHKRELLFGLYETARRRASGAVPVIVEGPFDAIAVNAVTDAYAGVSPCGVALTEQHVTALAATDVVIMLDGDASGRAAAVRAYRLLHRLPGTLGTVVLPDGTDPAEEFRAARLAGALEQVRPLADLVVDASIGPVDHPGRRLIALHSAAGAIATLRPADVTDQIIRVADRLGIGYRTLTRTVLSKLS